MGYISPRAIVEPGVYLGQDVSLLGPCHIKTGSIIEDHCIIGKPSRLQLVQLKNRLQNATQPLTYADYDEIVDTPTVIGEEALIHQGTLIYSGCILGEQVLCEDHTTVKWDTVVGPYTKLVVGALIGSYITIGKYCTIGGTCGNDSIIKDYSTCFGTLMHAYQQYGVKRETEHIENYSQYDIGRRDPAPRLEEHVTVGYDANIIGGIVIGTRSYVAAASIVTKDVPPDTIVTGHNLHHPITEWNGGLKKVHHATFQK